MIKRILKSQKINDKPYYYVQWNRTKKLPAWVTADDYPEIPALILKTGFLTQQERDRKQAKQKGGKEDFSFLNHKFKKSKEKRGKNKKQNYAKKLQREGIQKYNLTYLERLQKIIDKLSLQIERPTSSIILDYQIQYIDSVFKTKTNQICFIVNLVGKLQKFAVPLKKMKKHFPRTLKAYLQELVSVHKINQPQIQQVQQNPQKVRSKSAKKYKKKSPASKVKNKKKPLIVESEIYYESQSAPKSKSKSKQKSKSKSKQKSKSKSKQNSKSKSKSKPKNPKKSSKKHPSPAEKQPAQKTPASNSRQKRYASKKISAPLAQFGNLQKQLKRHQQPQQIEKMIQQKPIPIQTQQKIGELDAQQPKYFHEVFSQGSDNGQI